MPIEIGRIYDYYDGGIQSFDIDLASVIDLNQYEQGTFVLSVEANGSADQDWAAWIDARIERR